MLRFGLRFPLCGDLAFGENTQNVTLLPEDELHFDVLHVLCPCVFWRGEADELETRF